MERLDDAINVFLTVLRSSWLDVHRVLVDSVGRDDSVVYDWAQANWELIVEAALSKDGIVLEVYAAGADCNPASSRVWAPSRLPTHDIACVPRGTGRSALDQLTRSAVSFPQEGLLLVEFVTMVGGWYRAAPPFDHALLRRDGGDVVIRLADLSFSLRGAEP